MDLNCAALPENLLESELFGYEKGAFSGAEITKPGLFELADKGTIFLDEIGELDPRVQVKLLRVLDGAPYFRLGGVKKVTVDVRVVAATNADLEMAVERGRFRNDLFHRLSQFNLEVPPLRERLADIAPLAEYFLAQSYPELRFSPGAIEALRNYPWPGNIRELRNVVIRAAIVNDSGVIRSEDLPLKTVSIPAASGFLRPTGLISPDRNGTRNETAPPISNPAVSATMDPSWHSGNGAHSLENAERRLIFEALQATGGHHQRAADRLGISRRTLSRKLKVYGGWQDGSGHGNAGHSEATL